MIRRVFPNNIIAKWYKSIEKPFYFMKCARQAEHNDMVAWFDDGVT